MIHVFTSSRPGYPDRFRVKLKEFLGHKIATYHSDNAKSMPEFMRESINSLISTVTERKDKDLLIRDIIIFKHDDLMIANEANFFGQVMGLILNGGIDIVGVAGTSSYNPNNRLPTGDYPNWIQQEPVSGNKGLVHHPESGSWYPTYYGAPGEVNMVDGCCIAISGRIAEEALDFIDSLFDWHFYDISFCWNAHKAGKKIYTICSDVRHLSTGASAINWLEEAHKFFAIYSDGIKRKDRPAGGISKNPVESTAENMAGA